ncbi:helix-turn-helix domain-containing protein [Mycolicibacterium setense]
MQNRIDAALFATRLNQLFTTVRPVGRGPYRNIDVANALTAQGIAITPAYLSHLRRGVRQRPSLKVTTALATFFGVHVEYLTTSNTDYQRRLDADLHWLALAHNTTARRLTEALLQLPAHQRDELLNSLEGTRSSHDGFP